MPIKIQDKSYKVPGEGNEPNIKGSEIIEIEEHFGLDGLTLLGLLDPSAKPVKGYSYAKALFSLAWVVKNRAGEVCSIADVLNDVSIDQIQPEDDPKEEAAN